MSWHPAHTLSTIKLFVFYKLPLGLIPKVEDYNRHRIRESYKITTVHMTCFNRFQVVLFLASVAATVSGYYDNVYDNSHVELKELAHGMTQYHFYSYHYEIACKHFNWLPVYG